MKRLVVAAVLAACGTDGDDVAEDAGTLELHVVVTEAGGQLVAIDPTSECARQWYPLAPGACVSASDDSATCPGLNASPDQCINAAHFDGVDGVGYQQGRWSGNALGATLVITGCGEPISIPLPASAPAAPADVMGVDSLSTTTVTWLPDPSAETMYVASSYDSGSTFCRADASAGEFAIQNFSGPVYLRAESAVTSVTTELGTAYVRAGAGTDVVRR